MPTDQYSQPLHKFGKYKGKSLKPGGGGRFARLKDKLKGKVKNPGAVAAKVGRLKYGKSKFQKMAAAGRKRS